MKKSQQSPLPDVADVAYDALKATMAMANRAKTLVAAYPLLDKLIDHAHKVERACPNDREAMSKGVENYIEACVEASKGIVPSVHYTLAYLLAYHVALVPAFDVDVVQPFWKAMADDNTADEEADPLFATQWMLGNAMTLLQAFSDKQKKKSAGNVLANHRDQALIQAAEVSVRDLLEDRLLVDLTHTLPSARIHQLRAELLRQPWMAAESVTSHDSFSSPPPMDFNYRTAFVCTSAAPTDYVDHLRRAVPVLCELKGRVEDHAIFVGDLAVIVEKEKEEEEKEKEGAFADALQYMNFRATLRLLAPATLDTGDVFFTGRHLFVCESARTNRAAVDQLAIFFRRHQPGLAVLTTPTTPLRLKSCASLVADGVLLVGEKEEAATVSSILSTKEYRIVRVPDTLFASNVVRINNKLVAPKGFPRSELILAAEAKARGLELILVDSSAVVGALLCTLDVGGSGETLSDLDVFTRFMQVKHAALYATLLPVLRTPYINPATGAPNSRLIRDPVATLVPYCIHNFSQLSQQQIDAMHAWTQLSRQNLAPKN